MSASQVNNLKDLSTDEEYYQRVYDVFETVCDRREKMYEWICNDLPAVVDSIETDPGRALNVLSVGAGNGVIDLKMMSVLLVNHPLVHATILEPNPNVLQQYKALASKESAKLQGVSFEWRAETFDEYQKMTNKKRKFHFISCMSSIYYMGDLEPALQCLHGELDTGGILMVSLMSGEGGFGSLWQFLHKKFGRRGDLFTSSDVIEVSRNLNLNISVIQNFIYHCDLSACFGPPEELSEEASILLDFLTHTIGFARNALAECRDDVMRFLRSDACSDRGPLGQVILKGNNVAVFIRHE
ncbi:histamine N-methyltransferase A-like [Asterias rubens]|uniref:histamine N-methyltransferase A-like n=1 Tax=Asterias rubens TaxID=7604 RepID=UPI0014556207|nr:histamine N-methyltransferase A-like [Asterias rubens]